MSLDLRSASRTLALAALTLTVPAAASAAVFNPADVPGLIAAIDAANVNDVDDIIDLGGLVFSLSATNNVTVVGNNGLPSILLDGGHVLIIQNGTIERDAAAPNFRILHVQGSLILDRVELRNGAEFGVGGGAIFKLGQLTVSNSLFTGNQGAFGGAILISGSSGSSFAAVNSTFSGNTATVQGGAIHNASSNSSFSNCTITNNTAPTRGGVDNRSSIGSFVSNMVAGNTGGSEPDIGGLSPAAESNNLIGNNNGSGFVAGAPNVNNSYVGTPASPIDPLLDPLANNGGPTETHALQAGSLALQHGANPNALSFDQRGTPFLRTSGPATDIGAFEAQISVVEIPTLHPLAMLALTLLIAGAGVAALNGLGRHG